MPTSLKALTAKTATVTVDFGDGDTIEVTYRTHAYDEALEDELFAAQDEGKFAQAMRRAAQDVIVAWDLKADPKDKVSIGIDPDGLRDVPVSVLRPIIAAIQADMRDRQSPNPTTASS